MTGMYPGNMAAAAGMASNSKLFQPTPSRRPVASAASIAPNASRIFSIMRPSGPKNLSTPKKIVPAPHSCSMYCGSTGVKANESLTGTLPNFQTCAPMASLPQRSPSATWCAARMAANEKIPRTTAKPRIQFAPVGFGPFMLARGKGAYQLEVGSAGSSGN